MAMTKKTILSVETGKAVKNVGELRENIKQYKKELESLNIGSDEYRRTLTKLEENQLRCATPCTPPPRASPR